VEAGRRVEVFRSNPGTGERLGLLATATVGAGGWVDLTQPIVVQAGNPKLHFSLVNQPVFYRSR
jgi:hypothetical protein